MILTKPRTRNWWAVHTLRLPAILKFSENLLDRFADTTTMKPNV
jgi:hypothetical protein